MDFDKTVNWTAKIYKFLEKFNRENIFPIDNIVDNNFPQVLARLQTYSKILPVSHQSHKPNETSPS